jgi:hypothetical protein
MIHQDEKNGKTAQQVYAIETLPSENMGLGIRKSHISLCMKAVIAVRALAFPEAYLLLRGTFVGIPSTATF